MADVLIIGAGPAGAIAGALLARRGYEVLILERQQFPRFSIGESLLANSMQFIEEAGMLEAVHAGAFQFKNGAAFVRDGAYSDYNFAQKSSPGYAYTFQVPRADFDKVLADEAARQGAEIRYQVEITAADFSAAEPELRARNAAGEESRHRARFVLDASGFGRTLPRMLDLERPADFPVRAALFTHIEDHVEAGAFDRQKIRVSIHPRERDVWYWLIPFSNGRSSLGVVATREFHQRYQGSTSERLWQIVGEEPSLAKLLAQSRPVAQVGEIVGYAASVKALHGNGFALLGNAAEFLDPVFSSGVTIAMQSASLAARALDRQLRGETVDWNADFDAPLKYGVETFRAFVNSWYDGTLQDVIFHTRQDEPIRRHICSVLAGYAWDTANPYTGTQAQRRLAALARLCRNA
ncbi:MAG TPA: FAD-dependent monooxygenase [Steroidobacteraceae bacterium]|nr:FAD-dependent monooxygenase [Steroidobacteraceae bacterium]